MIKRPWQIWTSYALCVLLVVSAMVVLTITTWQLDLARETERQQTEIARRQAELQERTSSALWRMDWLMIPLVAQEAARPYHMYRPFYVDEPGANLDAADQLQLLRPSPLLTQPSEFILLHFQIEPDNEFLSPQDPQGDSREQAMVACNVPAKALESSRERLAELRKLCSYESLSFSCPQDRLPSVEKLDFPWQSSELGAQVAKNMASPRQALVDNNAQAAEFQMQQQAEQSQLDEALDSSPDQIGELQRKRNLDRGNKEFLQRDKATQSYAKGQLNLNMVQTFDPNADASVVREGVMRPIWVGDLLILARRVELGSRTVIQGCWLDWDKIKSALAKEIVEVLPNVGLEPMRDDNDTSPGRRMATLPVQLTDVEQSLATIGLASISASGSTAISGLKLSLAVAWVGLVLGLAAIAALLRGVLRLSERRAAFASAVTHELRTPLTTFRMYAEMLAEGMVPTAEKQRHYARTMKVEADRLGHLVENVLRYARLERRAVATRTVPTSVDALFERFQNRLLERASQAGMTLSLEIDPATGKSAISTEPGTVEQIVFNLVDNACKYAASASDKTIHLMVRTNGFGGVKLSDNEPARERSATVPSPSVGRAREGALLSITVRDHGPGIDAKMSKRLFTAFSKSDQDAAETARGVGLGLALCRRMAVDLGGRLVWDKSCTAGASFTLTLPGTSS